MEFDELLITTGVDALVRLVKEKSKVELEEAASVLNIPQETLEDWARVLEEEGILRIEYRLTRIYLVWVKPTEEEVATETKSFYEEKKGVESEVEEVHTRISQQTEGIEELRKSFTDFYTKAYPKLEELERSISPIPAAKAISDDVLAKQEGVLQSFDIQFDDIKRGVAEIRNELEQMGIEREVSESKKWMDQLEKMNAELIGMQSELQDVRKKASQQAPEEVNLPTVSEIKKKFEAIKKDFAELRSKNAQMRQDMISLHESSEILKSVAESIMGHEEKVESLHNDMASLSEEADILMEKAKTVSAKVKENVELIERFGDTVTVAKGILNRFPSQEKVFEELDKVKSAEETLVDKAQGLEKLLEAAGGKQVTAKQFAEITKRIDDKIYQMRRDMDSLASALEDEKATYLTFQKIKERIVPSIESYEKQLSTIENDITKIKEDTVVQQEAMRDNARKLEESFKGDDAQSVFKVAEDIQEKKRMLDDIRQSIEDLTTMSENLNKRITLLSREAKLLEIRTGGETTEAVEAKGKELRHELELSQAEELEFRRKREELKNLIKKLWEQ